MSAWKDLERRVARALGGERSGPLGRYGSDVQGAPFAVECKRTTRYSLRWLMPLAPCLFAVIRGGQTRWFVFYKPLSVADYLDAAFEEWWELSA